MFWSATSSNDGRSYFDAYVSAPPEESCSASIVTIGAEAELFRLNFAPDLGPAESEFFNRHFDAESSASLDFTVF